jgi:hypothetical protein
MDKSNYRQLYKSYDHINYAKCFLCYTYHIFLKQQLFMEVLNFYEINRHMDTRYGFAELILYSFSARFQQNIMEGVLLNHLYNQDGVQPNMVLLHLN